MLAFFSLVAYRIINYTLQKRNDYCLPVICELKLLIFCIPGDFDGTIFALRNHASRFSPIHHSKVYLYNYNDLEYFEAMIFACT